ncbi:hypothetical protein B9Z55_013010 [Caenorhabditis nigoni]|uniref:T-box domain-containing protein n=1 Tax=Caenorhabditis nigoni TaxID=1611254 RepID=A0A2G5TZU0_9PELO|nr:hypothetical protein B9Z55_013010 [Caenorhabditis nigoni]
MNTITVRCTSEEAWREKGNGGKNEEHNELKCAEIILNRFPPENLGFEYEVTGLEEDSNYEMELLFDPSKYAEKILRRVEKEIFHIRTPRVREPKQLDIKTISHVKNPQRGSDWMKSTVNFDKIRLRKKEPAGASEVTLTSGVMYQVKLRIQKIGGEEKILGIPHQYFVACSHEYVSQKKKKTNEDSEADTDTFEPAEEASQKRRSQGMTPSTSDNFGMRQAFDAVPHAVNPIQPDVFGAFWPAVNPTQLQPMNIDLKSVQSLLGGIPGPFSQQGAGPLINTQQVNIEQRQPNMMPSTSNNSELSLSDIEDLLEQQRATGTLLTVEQVAVYANLLAAQALTSNPVQQQQMNRIIQRLLGGYPGLFSHEGAAQVLNPPPVNIVQRPVVVNPVEEPPINPEREQEPPRHPEQD